MRSEFKKAARTIVPSRYELFHEAEQYEDNTAAAEHIKDGIKDLLEAGKFLRGGLDAQVRIKLLDDLLLTSTLVQGRTDNLAHAALEELCKTYYYLGKNALARSFPDIFANSIPKGAVALAGTVVSGVIFYERALIFFQLAAALDEYKTGVWQSGKLHVDTYRPVHEGILMMMEQIEADHYHNSKCRGFRRQWAKAAWYDFSPLLCILLLM
jgi:hypothetical protein